MKILTQNCLKSVSKHFSEAAPFTVWRGGTPYGGNAS